MLYSIALFLHVLGALGMFVALGVEWTSLRNLPHATSAREARGCPVRRSALSACGESRRELQDPLAPPCSCHVALS